MKKQHAMNSEISTHNLTDGWFLDAELDANKKIKTMNFHKGFGLEGLYLNENSTKLLHDIFSKARGEL